MAVSWPSFIVISRILFKTCPQCAVSKLILILCFFFARTPRALCVHFVARFFLRAPRRTQCVCVFLLFLCHCFSLSICLHSASDSHRTEWLPFAFLFLPLVAFFAAFGHSLFTFYSNNLYNRFLFSFVHLPAFYLTPSPQVIVSDISVCRSVV